MARQTSQTPMVRARPDVCLGGADVWGQMCRSAVSLLPIAAEQEPVLWLHPGRFCMPKASCGSASPSALLGEAARGWGQLCCALGSPALVLPPEGEGVLLLIPLCAHEIGAAAHALAWGICEY